MEVQIVPLAALFKLKTNASVVFYPLRCFQIDKNSQLWMTNLPEMKNIFLILYGLLLLLITGCTKLSTEITLYDLKCENLDNPQGIGTTEPAFGWKLASSVNGSSQKAYQVLVASDLKYLNEEDADLWNSGKVKSSDQVMTIYDGKELKSRSVCYWKVRIWDQNNDFSEWSPEYSFSVGLLNDSDWSASYIGLRSESENTIAPQFRKNFIVETKPRKIFLFVNSLGYHEVILNGKKVGDKVLAPAVSQFSKRSQVVTYDISALVNVGRNDLVLWTGKGWYTKGLPGVGFDGPLVRAQIDIPDNDSWITILKTDSTWLCRNSGYYTTGTWLPGQFGGETVDGRMNLTDLNSQSLDIAKWSPVEVVSVTEHLATSQLSEANIITDTISPVKIQSIGKNSWLIDMGTTLTGWTEIRLKSLKPGQEILIEYSDHLDKEGKVVDQGQSDKYIACGKQPEVFKNKFNYHGFRYIKISNLKNQPLKDEIYSYPIRTGYNLASSFECSDPDMNAIHNMIFYTLQCLSLGGYLVDCPQIERLGYGGDGNASTETAQTMFDLAPLYRNWLQAWGDCLREDGGMPHTAPNPYSAGGGPYWCGFVITASWRTYMNYGDRRILEKYYPVMQKWLTYADRYSPSGLLEPWPETDYRSWYLGDWASPEGTDHTDSASIKLVNNCFMTVCFETMEKIANVLGKKEEAQMYSSRKQKIADLINSELFNKTNNTYGSGIQVDMTYPLLAGVVPVNLEEKIENRLKDVILNEHNGHIACGLVGIPVFTEWSVNNRETDLFYSMLKKREYPGYLYMIDNGATTTWEHWNGARSRIHNCYNGIGSWFYQSVGGIRKDENIPGYRQVIIDPVIPEGITWANTTKETPYGTVKVNWMIENGFFRMNIKLPPGCQGNVLIPEGVEEYELNGVSSKKKNEPMLIESGVYDIQYNFD